MTPSPGHFNVQTTRSDLDANRDSVLLSHALDTCSSKNYLTHTAKSDEAMQISGSNLIITSRTLFEMPALITLQFDANSGLVSP